MISRRGLLFGALAAPAIVRASSLMAISAVPRWLWGSTTTAIDTAGADLIVSSLDISDLIFGMIIPTATPFLVDYQFAEKRALIVDL